MNEAPRTPSVARLLPWVSPAGKPAYLVTDDRASRLWCLADEMEAAQLDRSAEVMAWSKAVLEDLMSPYSQVRYAGIRLGECLADVLRIAESRGLRLDITDEPEV
ncbi:hypothetical protein [Streptomyces sp. NPDC046887]|uniref:hypothetical protein n=1 Tax=Streptomyces sp. NPDC046887 TaxID=3155472 RepID=UPI0033F29AEC